MSGQYEVRAYTHESGAGRMDEQGNEWFACDPYPTWYRWEGRRLITPPSEPRWKATPTKGTPA